MWLLLTVYRGKADRLGPRSYSPPSRFVEFLAIKLLAPWRSLTSVYPCSSYSLVPSDFNGLFEPAWLRRNSDRPQYARRKRVACISLGMTFQSYQKTLQPRVPSGAQTKSSPQSSTHPPPKNGQTRRRPVELPGSNTGVWLGFVFKTFIVQKLLYVVRGVLKSVFENLSLRSGRTKKAAGQR